MRLGPYQTWIFDCDGVLLDSNRAKSDAFRDVAAPYGPEAVERLVQHHRSLGGVSRFEKIRYFFEDILQLDNPTDEIERGILIYGEAVRGRLATCAEAPGLREFLARIPTGCRRFVVSGGFEPEVADTLNSRELTFDGIFGSPATKTEIFEALAATGDLDGGAVYLGDSRYDYEAAVACSLDFVFVYGLTEFEGWREFFADTKVACVESLENIDIIATALNPSSVST